MPCLTYYINNVEYDLNSRLSHYIFLKLEEHTYHWTVQMMWRMSFASVIAFGFLFVLFIKLLKTIVYINQQFAALQYEGL
jgi:hypothetical protein